MFARFRRLTWNASLLATVVSMLTFTITLAAPGDLDTTFDGDGLVTSYASPSNPGRHDRARGIALQADGKIVVSGYSFIPNSTIWDFAALRYNTDGSLDPTFSGDGRLLTSFSASGRDTASDVALQSNGKIVVAGQVCLNGDVDCKVALARYNPNGTLDTTFSGDGKQTNDFGGSDAGSSSVAIQSNGKIVVAGYMLNGSDTDVAVYRYLSNGSLDITFGGDGMVNISFGVGRDDYASDLAIQSDGKIIVAGSSHRTGSFIDSNFVITRLNAGGSLDITFSGDGKQITDFGALEYASGVALQPNGKIVVAGSKRSTSLLDSFALARYNTNGSLDATFNSTGKKVFSVITGKDSRAEDVVVQPDGKIVVLGTVYRTDFNGPNQDFALVRLNSGGSFDTTLRGDGKVLVDFGENDWSSALAIQPLDGKYVLVGDANIADSDFGLVRVLP